MNQHNPFMYVEIAWIMIMFNNSHSLLFYFFSYIFLLLFAFFLPFLFIYITFILFNLVLVSLFLFHIIIAWHVFSIVFLLCLFSLYYYFFIHIICFCFLLLFVSFSFVFFIFIRIIEHYSIIHYSPHKLDCVLSYWFNYQKEICGDLFW